MQVDAAKVIKKLTNRIAQLEEQNAILTVQLEECLEVTNELNKIEESVKK